MLEEQGGGSALMRGGFASELTHKILNHEPKSCTAEFQANISTTSISDAQMHSGNIICFICKPHLDTCIFFVNMGIKISRPNKSCRLSYLVQDVINMIKLRRQMSRGGLELCSLKFLLACLQVALSVGESSQPFQHTP